MPGPLRNLLRPPLQAALRLRSAHWPSHSRLFVVSDSGNWVLEWERRELARLFASLAVPVPASRWLHLSRRQASFYLNHLGLLTSPWPEWGHRIATAYYHGLPGTGEPAFDACYDRLRREHPRLARVVVSHRLMRDALLEAGIDPHKLFLIPIGINPALFSVQTDDSRRGARERLAIPPDAALVGSFQKDGVGWGEGLEPKRIKGPDVFLRAIELMKPRVRNLHVLLSGPARGFVRQGLARLGVPCTHVYPRDYASVGGLFQALDVAIVSSRQEGGPKAVLESMASGVPLVTTAVGQAVDLVEHGGNGWIVPVEDSAALADSAADAIARRGTLGPLLARARATAEANSYDAQRPLWRDFLQGFVDRKDSL